VVSLGIMLLDYSVELPELPVEDSKQVRKTPSWPRSWANFSLLSLYSHRNTWASLHLLGQPNTFLARSGPTTCGPAAAAMAEGDGVTRTAICRPCSHLVWSYSPQN
jgi:hypothetical protein